VPETRAGREAGRRTAEAEPPPNADDGDGRPLVCNVAFCPICLAVTAAQAAAPDAIEHLLKAAGEFFLAARAVIDARGDHLAGDGAKHKPDLQRIEIG
jgi:hypothetical protein